MERLSWWICVALVALGNPLQAQPPTAQHSFEVQLERSAAELRISDTAANRSHGMEAPIRCDGTTDNTAAFNAALAAGTPIVLDPQPGFCKVSGPLMITHPGQLVIGSGARSAIRLVLPDGAPVVPLFWVRRTATGARIDNLWIDHNAGKLAPPEPCRGALNPYFGQAMIVEADYVTVTRSHIENAWDNGLGVGYIDEDCVQHRATPVGVQVFLLSGRNNGQGIHDYGGIGRQGALFDNLTGSGTVADGVYDSASYGCFIEDYAGGATGSFSNIQCNGTVWDKSTPRSKADTGIAAYVGGTDTTITGLIALYPGQLGIWIDTYATAVTIDGCEVKTSGSHGILIKGASDIVLHGCREKNIGYGTSAAPNAIELDSTLAPINHLLITDNEVSHDGDRMYNAYGVGRIGSHPVSGRINGWLEGAKAPTQAGVGVEVDDISRDQSATTGDGAHRQ